MGASPCHNFRIAQLEKLVKRKNKSISISYAERGLFCGLSTFCIATYKFSHFAAADRDDSPVFHMYRSLFVVYMLYMCFIDQTSRAYSKEIVFLGRLFNGGDGAPAAIYGTGSTMYGIIVFSLKK